MKFKILSSFSDLLHECVSLICILFTLFTPFIKEDTMVFLGISPSSEHQNSVTENYKQCKMILLNFSFNRW